jgi:hypothetical protein
MVEHVLGVASFWTAVLSAWLWAKAARLQLPLISADGGDSGGLAQILSRQARLNSHAAFSAAFSALFQGLSLLWHFLTE